MCGVINVKHTGVFKRMHRRPAAKAVTVGTNIGTLSTRGPPGARSIEEHQNPPPFSLGPVSRSLLRSVSRHVSEEKNTTVLWTLLAFLLTGFTQTG